MVYTGFVLQVVLLARSPTLPVDGERASLSRTSFHGNAKRIGSDAALVFGSRMRQPKVVEFKSDESLATVALLAAPTDSVKKSLLKKRDFIYVDDFSKEEFFQTMELAKELKARKNSGDVSFKPFSGRSLAMIFAKQSARTRISFETGFTWMGGHAVYLAPNDIAIGQREAVKDIARVISGFNDMIMARLYAHSHILEIAEYASVPVVNGLTDYNHPCQIMADAFTIIEHTGKLENKKIVYVGDGNNIVHSWLRLARVVPLHFVCLNPEGYDPDEDTVKYARETGVSQIEVSHDVASAVKDADIIYTDVWASMGQKDQAEARTKVFAEYQVNEGLMAKTGRADTLFMHCLPAERDREVTDAVMEAPTSVVFAQAENRMHAQNAIMLKIAGLA